MPPRLFRFIFSHLRHVYLHAFIDAPLASDHER
jgi:hypothetical protein